MRALGFREHGEIENFEILDLPKPAPGAGEALVRIKACALNRLDIWVCRGWRGLDLRLPHISGSDGAGIVEEVGQNVSEISAGDRVSIYPGINLFEDEYTKRGEHSVSPGYVIIGEHLPGTHAEYAAVPAKNLYPLPENLSFENAAAAGLVFLAAWRMLVRRAGIEAGQSVLVIGAGGGVNSAAVQIAKHLGCTVYATTSAEAKMKRAVELGADEAVNYRENPDWAKTIYKMTGKRGVDIVVDNVGQATLPDSMRVVARGGKIVIVGNTSGYDARLDTRYIFGKQIQIIGSTMGNHEDYLRVMELVSAGKLRPVIDRILPLEQGVEAVRLMERGEKFGKIVLTP